MWNSLWITTKCHPRAHSTRYGNRVHSSLTSPVRMGNGHTCNKCCVAYVHLCTCFVCHSSQIFSFFVLRSSIQRMRVRKELNMKLLSSHRLLLAIFLQMWWCNLYFIAYINLNRQILYPLTMMCNAHCTFNSDWVFNAHGILDQYFCKKNVSLTNSINISIR